YPVDTSCRCYACTRFTRAYLRHLYEAGEVLGNVLGSIHNLAFFEDLTARTRKAVNEDRFDAWRGEFLAGYRGGEGEADEGEEGGRKRERGSRGKAERGEGAGKPDGGHGKRGRGKREWGLWNRE
ncbi:MAG: tRNA-guanine transglycosylase, partial [Planctomycetes bacterium]|nr:tRNA-guanine transglycosylase [Planctomycetota bacterium]